MTRTIGAFVLYTRPRKADTARHSGIAREKNYLELWLRGHHVGIAK